MGTIKRTGDCKTIYDVLHQKARNAKFMAEEARWRPDGRWADRSVDYYEGEEYAFILAAALIMSDERPIGGGRDD